MAAFERDYPPECRKTGALKKVAIDPEEMRTLAAAFAALDPIAQDPASDAHLRAVARSFATQMNYRVNAQTSL